MEKADCGTTPFGRVGGKTHALRALACVGAALLLVACGASGPSKSEAKEAISTWTYQTMGYTPEQAAALQITVDEMTCTETSTAEVYSCRVMWTMTGPAGSRQQTANFEFVKVGGQWQAKA